MYKTLTPQVMGETITLAAKIREESCWIGYHEHGTLKIVVERRGSKQ